MCVTIKLFNTDGWEFLNHLKYFDISTQFILSHTCVAWVEVEVEVCQLKPSGIYLKHMHREFDNEKTETELDNWKIYLTTQSGQEREGWGLSEDKIVIRIEMIADSRIVYCLSW